MRELASPQPGYFEIFQGPEPCGWYLCFNCPCGCPYLDIVPLDLGEARGAHRWGWDGNKTHPTISGSFKRHTPCAAHFFLKAGRFEFLGDGAPKAANCYAAPELK
jgi:Family of unknown function (DUF6527)